MHQQLARCLAKQSLESSARSIEIAFALLADATKDESNAILKASGAVDAARLLFAQAKTAS